MNQPLKPRAEHALDRRSNDSTRATLHAVIVTFQPDLERLKTLCSALTRSSVQVIIVDNSPSASIQVGVNKQLTGYQRIALGRNTGIAHAQNVGVTAALDDGADAIVFFDQDSSIHAGFVDALIAPLRFGEPDVVAATCVDDLDGTPLPSLRVNRYGRVTPIWCGLDAQPYDVDVVISSGSAATRETFALAGEFEASYFIDLVDTEWCLRCRAKGIPIRVVPNAVMYHRIGSSSTRIGPFTVSTHKPLRCYYQIRNSFLLLRKPHVPLLFAVHEIASIILNRTLLLFVVSEKLEYLRAYLRGTLDGLTGNTDRERY